MTAIEINKPEWHPSNHGAELYIDQEQVCKEYITDPVIPLVFDIETTGDEKDQFVGIGLAIDDAKLFYFSTFSPFVKHLLETHPLIAHNAKADIRWAIKYGAKVSMANVCVDTMVLHYTFTSRGKHGLKDTAKDLLGLTWPTYKEMITQVETTTKISKRGKITTKTKAVQKNLESVDKELIAAYNGMDVLATYRLWLFLEKTLSDRQLKYYTELEHPTMQLIGEMEMKGITIDVDKLHKISSSLKQQLVLTEKQLKQRSGGINLNSPIQVKEWLQKEGLDIKSTNEAQLDRFRNVPIVQLLFHYRELSKLVGTYLDPLAQSPNLPHLYSQFNQCITVTGRLSSSNPNLQNMPARTELGKKLRSLVIASPNHKLVVADLSQIELRIAAHFSHDPILMEAFTTDQDLHTLTATRLGIPRPVAKLLNFASLYGSSAYNLSIKCHLSLSDAQRFLDQYWQTMEGLRTWKEQMIQEASRQGGIRTLAGRWIDIPDMCLPVAKEKTYTPEAKARRKAEREVISYIVQGSAAEYMKYAMVSLYRANYIPSIQVHDEVVVEVKDQDVPQAELEIKDLMEHARITDVPIKVNIGHGNNWGEAK